MNKSSGIIMPLLLFSERNQISHALLRMVYTANIEILDKSSGPDESHSFGENDAPTIIYEGSHMDVSRLLCQEDDSGLSFMQLAGKLDGLPERKEVYATGKAGTVYLCHPFLVHSAQSHRGMNPKFMAQPPLLLRTELTISGSHGEYTPVEQAIRLGLS